MGVIDDLRKQSESLRTSKQAEKDRRKEHDRVYQDTIKPRISALYDYLKELIDHLVFLKTETPVSYRFRGSNAEFGFNQQNYRLRTQGSQDITAIHLFCDAVAITPPTLTVRGESVATPLIKELKEHALNASSHRAANGNAKIEIEPMIPIQFNFAVDRDHNCVIFTLNNYSELGIIREIFQPEQLTDQWLDDIGALIVRKSDRIIRRSLTVEQRIKIKQRLDQEEENKTTSPQKEERIRKKKGWKSLFSSH